MIQLKKRWLKWIFLLILIRKIVKKYVKIFKEHIYKNNEFEELAPGKIIFFVSRNQDSPNLYHGGSEFINALSLMYLLNLDPEDIQIIFLESMVINDDPFYDLYSNLIGRGGKPIYARDLNTNKKVLNEYIDYS